MSANRMYVIEERSFSGGQESWHRVSATGNLQEAIQRCRSHIKTGGSYRIVQFDRMRVTGTFHGAGVRK